MGLPTIKTPIATDLEYAWCAGFIDGDGCFFISGYASKRISVRLKISQKELEPLTKIRKILGGGIYGPFLSPSRTKKYGEDVAPIYHYILGAPHLRRHISGLWPHLTNLKRKQYKEKKAINLWKLQSELTN